MKISSANPRWAALILCLLVLGFYVYTLLPSLAWVDGMKHQQEVISGESLTLAEFPDSLFAPDPFPFARLGVAAWDHPLYVIVGHTVIQLLPGVDRLWLVNLFSAVFGAAASAVFFRLCYAHTQSLAASLAASLFLAVSHTYWFHAVTPETYQPFSFLLLSSVYFFDQHERTGQNSTLIASLFVLGLAGSIHLLAFFAFPSAALYFLISGRLRRPSDIHLRRMIAPGLAFVAGFSVYLIQLLRMLRTFPIATVMGPVAGSFFVRDALVTTTLLLLAKSALYYLLLLVTQFGPVGLIVGVYGWRVGSQAYPSLWRKAVALYAVYTVFGIFYRVLEQYAVYMFSHIFWAMAIGMGAARLFSVLPERRRGWLIAGLGVMIVAMPLYYGVQPALVRSAGFSDETFGIPQVGTGARDGLAYYLNPNKRGYDAPYKFGRETLANLPPRSVVVAEWYNDVDVALVLRYFYTLEHMRPDVEIVIWLLEEPTNFDSNIAVRKIETELQNNRPVFLASLNDKFYDATRLKKKHCIVPEDNLYRVYPGSPETSASEGLSCIK